jgi:large subunit ribosomal protein L25
MAEMPNIQATQRTRTGKGAARQARRENLVPGVIYGGGSDPMPINLKFNELYKMLKAGKFMSTLMSVTIDDKKTNALCRDVQRDVVNGLPVHVDFMRVSAKSRVEVFVPIVFLNESEAVGVKRGGSLTEVRPEIELLVSASDIPDHLEVDVAKMDFGDILHASDLTLPKGASFVIDDRDPVIATMDAPRTSDDSDEDADEAVEDDEDDEAKED